MILLAVETTANLATVALFRDGALVAEREADANKKHAETILPLIDYLLEENAVSITQIDLFAVDVGPGSFTGVRIGVSLVNALTFATGRQVIAIDALQALYQSSGEDEKAVCAMIDARNGNAYAALYQAGKTLLAPEAVVTEAFLAQIPADAVFVGDAHTQELRFPRASNVGFCALKQVDSARLCAEPLYLRSSQAERMRQVPIKEA